MTEQEDKNANAKLLTLMAHLNSIVLYKNYKDDKNNVSEKDVLLGLMRNQIELMRFLMIQSKEFNYEKIEKMTRFDETEDRWLIDFNTQGR